MLTYNLKAFASLIFFILLINMANTASVSSTVAESSSTFSRNLFTQIIDTKPAENIVLSPVSVQTCVALAFFGAKGQTETEIANGLSLGTSDKTVVAKRFNNLLKSTSTSDLLSIANKIYANHHLNIKKEFHAIAKESFQSEAEAINFNEGDKAVFKINSWVESKTNNNIKNLLSFVEPETSIILVNAIHLKAEWTYKFYKSSTRKSDFWISSDKSLQVDTMTNSDNYNYAEWSDLDAVAVGMPYQNSDLSMVIVLPNQRNGLEALEKKLANADLLNLSNQMPIHDVNVYLPKFKIESKFKLNDALKNMGMSTMFSDQADFSDLFEETTPVKVSEVVHKAFINVDEDGTEASAATYLKGFGSSLSFNHVQKQFKVDRPFLYFIKNQDYIYFIGHVIKPSV